MQKEIAGKVVARDDFSGKIELVCGVDVSYRQGVAHCSAAVTDLSFNMVEQASTASPVTQPYIPGLFMLREAGPVLRTLKRIRRYDLLLVDGHGQLHPRRCGLACFVGVTLDRPAIGVAKSILCGKVKGENIELACQVLGRLVNGRLYVSVGHRISLGTAADIVKRLVAEKSWMPEPLRLADEMSKK
ncbi:MAG: endonuclease V [Nitrososphaera sp.]